MGVGLIHLQRIRHFLPQPKRRRRRGRRYDHIHFLESVGEVASNQRPHLLRPQIIGVVVAGGQRVSPQHNSPLHFRAEATFARFAIHLDQRAARHAQPVSNSIVASQIRAGLRRGDDVVRRQSRSPCAAYPAEYTWQPVFSNFKRANGPLSTFSLYTRHTNPTPK